VSVSIWKKRNPCWKQLSNYERTSKPGREFLPLGSSGATMDRRSGAAQEKQRSMQKSSTTGRRHDGIGIPPVIRPFAVANENKQNKGQNYEVNQEPQCIRPCGYW
jgi:hypothetical protein